MYVMDTKINDSPISTLKVLTGLCSRFTAWDFISTPVANGGHESRGTGSGNALISGQTARRR